MSAQVEALRPYQPQTPRWIEKTNRFIDQTVETAREVGHNLAQAGIYAATRPRETALKAAQNIYENRLEIGAGMASNRVITTAAHATLGTMDAIPGAGLAVKFTAITAAGTAKQALRFNRTITENGLKATFEDSKQKAVAIDSDNLVHDSIAWARTGIESNIAHLAFQTGRKEAAMRAIDASNVDNSITNMSPDEIVNIMYTFSQAHRFNKDQVTKQEANQRAMTFLTAAKQHLSPDEYQMVWDGYKQKLFGDHITMPDGTRTQNNRGSRNQRFDANRAIYVGGIAFTRALRRTPTTLATSSLIGGAIHQIAEHTQLDEYASALGHKAIEAVKNAHIGEKFRDLAAHIQTPNFGQAMARAGRWFGDRISTPAAAATLTAQEREQLGYDQPPITNTGTLTNTHTLNTTTHISQPLPDTIDHQTNVDIHTSETPTAPITPHLGPEIDQAIPELEISYTFEGHDYFSNAFFKTLMQLPAYQDVNSVEDMWTQPGTANDFLRLAKVGLIEAGYTDLSELPDSVDQDMTWAQLYHEFPHAFSSLNSFGVEGDDYADQFEITLAPEDVDLVGAPGVTEHLELHDVVNATDHIDTTSPVEDVTSHATATPDINHTSDMDQPRLDPGHNAYDSQPETTQTTTTQTATTPNNEYIENSTAVETVFNSYELNNHISTIVFEHIAQFHPDYADTSISANELFSTPGSADLFRQYAFTTLIKEGILDRADAATLNDYIDHHPDASFGTLYADNTAQFAGMNNPDHSRFIKLPKLNLEVSTSETVESNSIITPDTPGYQLDNDFVAYPETTPELRDSERMASIRHWLETYGIDENNTLTTPESIQSTESISLTNSTFDTDIPQSKSGTYVPIRNIYHSGNISEEARANIKNLRYNIDEAYVYDPTPDIDGNPTLEPGQPVVLITCGSNYEGPDATTIVVNFEPIDNIPSNDTNKGIAALSTPNDIKPLIFQPHSLRLRATGEYSIGDKWRVLAEEFALNRNFGEMVGLTSEQFQQLEIPRSDIQMDNGNFVVQVKSVLDPETGRTIAYFNLENAPKFTVTSADGTTLEYAMTAATFRPRSEYQFNTDFMSNLFATTTSVEPHLGT